MQKRMRKKLIILSCVILVFSMILMTSCGQKKAVDGAYDFIIYESDSDNSNLSDNPIVSTYHIEYSNSQTVVDTLAKKGTSYFFSDDSEDYLVLEDGPYGLTYTYGYFKNYANEPIDVSWSYTAVNGIASTYGISETPLQDLKEYGFVINGWK